MFHIVLYQPEIPPNTGNIIRLCSNSGGFLHLIRPLGFSLTDKQYRRSGLDYKHQPTIYNELGACLQSRDLNRVFAISTKGQRHYHEISYKPNDTFIFGPESRGLPENVLHTFDRDHILRIPMLPSSRSINLSNAVSIVLYEAWRQQSFTAAL